MKRTQEFTYDTRPDVVFVQEWDDDFPDAEPVVVAARLQDGTPVNDFGAAHAATLELNRHKNLDLVPALLAALPPEEKFVAKDDRGEDVEAFRTPPVFREVDGELRVDVSHIRSKAVRDSLAAAAATKKQEFADRKG